MVSAVSIPFFTDQNVPDSAGNTLVRAGHSLTRLRDVMATTTADPTIAVACSQSGHVLVSHDKDFRQVARRLNITQRQYQNSLHRILLACPEPDAATRLTAALSLIESEWAHPRNGCPMVIEIRSKSIMTFR